jgi:hypothetical protein
MEQGLLLAWNGYNMAGYAGGPGFLTVPKEELLKMGASGTIWGRK